MMEKHEFYFETSLYEAINISELEKDFFMGDVDGYSSKNNIETTYYITCNGKIYSFGKYSLSNGFSEITLTCKRKGDDVITYFVYVNDNIIVKVGQLPSLADIQYGELGRKYNKYISKEDLKNYKKAIGLYAHSAGAGSLVYLRRIFENLIIETYEKNKADLGIEEDDFIAKKMDEKVEILKKYLPNNLLKMKRIYGIMSKGIHELSEEECLMYFSPLKLSIGLILKQRKENQEIEDEEKLVMDTIAGIKV